MIGLINCPPIHSMCRCVIEPVDDKIEGQDKPPILTADGLKAMIKYFRERPKPQTLFGLPIIKRDNIDFPDISKIRIGSPLIREEEWEESP